MKTNLNFEDEGTKKLLSKLDFEFFLKQNIAIEKYNQSDVSTIYESYKAAQKEIKLKSNENRKQFNFYTEGQVRKMFTGGFLPALFELDEGRKNTFLNFPAVGESWAYFKYWQTYQKRKVTREKIWDIIIKTGSILAIFLTATEIYKYLHK